MNKDNVNVHVDEMYEHTPQLQVHICMCVQRFLGVRSVKGVVNGTAYTHTTPISGGNAHQSQAEVILS